MKRTLVSVIILVVAFFAIMIVGAKANGTVINLESGEGIEYAFYSIVSVIMSLCAACYFGSNRKRCIMFLLFAWLLPLVAGITTFLVAAVFSSLITVVTDQKVLNWFKEMAEPDKGCTLDETDE